MLAPVNTSTYILYLFLQDSIGLVIDESVSQADETFEDNDPTVDNTDLNSLDIMDNDIEDDGGGGNVPLIVDAWSDVNNQQQVKLTFKIQ